MPNRKPIETKIEMLIQWMNKYPKAKVSYQASEDILREYAKTDEEYIIMSKEYKKMQAYYTYVRIRKGQNKLTQDLILKCKEGNIGGVFGYPTKIEELAKANGIDVETTQYIISKYGTIEAFKNAYRRGELREEDLDILGSITKNILDIDFGPNSNNYDMLYCAIFEKTMRDNRLELYSSEKLKEMVQTLSQRERFVIEEKYRILTGGEPRTLADIGRELNLTRARIAQIEAQALRRLIIPSRHRQFRYYVEGLENGSVISDDDKNRIRELVDDIYASDLLMRNGNTITSINDIENIGIIQGIELLRSVHSVIYERIPEKEHQRVQAAVGLNLPTVEIGVSKGVDLDMVVPVPIGEDEKTTEVKKETSELKEVRAKKEALQIQIRGLEAIIEEAKALMRAYDELLGEGEIEDNEGEKDSYRN